MIINLETVSADQLEEAIDSLDPSWTDQLYFFGSRTTPSVVQAYLDRLDESDIRGLNELFSEDIWRGILETVDYFQNLFDISLPIEVVCDQTESKSKIYYSYGYNCVTGEIFHSEIIVSVGALDSPELFQYLSHEV